MYTIYDICIKVPGMCDIYCVMCVNRSCFFLFYQIMNFTSQSVFEEVHLKGSSLCQHACSLWCELHGNMGICKWRSLTVRFWMPFSPHAVQLQSGGGGAHRDGQMLSGNGQLWQVWLIMSLIHSAHSPDEDGGLVGSPLTFCLFSEGSSCVSILPCWTLPKG